VLAKKSKNFEEIPVLGGMMWPFFCITMNFLTIIGFLEGLEINTWIDFILKYKVFFSFGSGGLLLFYYSYKGRYKKIIEHYEAKKKRSIQIHPVIVIIFYYVGSFGLFLLAALFKNKVWIFAQ
jgi:hypothetical protein